MYKQILQSIQNVEVWAVISLVIFFVFFIGISIKVLLIDKKYIKKMEDMPLDDGTVDNRSIK
jgi:cytochrome c oxidase cbb3-type subunit 3